MKEKAMNDQTTHRQNAQIKVPEHAFNSSLSLHLYPEYQDLRGRFVTISAAHRKSFNQRAFFGVLPATVTSMFVTPLAFSLSYMASLGKTPAPILTSLVTAGANLLILTGSAVLTGAYRDFRILRRIRRPVLVLDAHRDNWNPMPPPGNVRAAVRTLESIEEELTAPIPRQQKRRFLPRSLDK